MNNYGLGKYHKDQHTHPIVLAGRIRGPGGADIVALRTHIAIITVKTVGVEADG